MRNYKIPFDFNFEDKIIGGKLSMRQAMWFAVPVVLFMGAIQFPGMLSSWKKIFVFAIIEIILFTIAILFSFINIEQISLDKYILLKIKFKLRKRRIKNYE